MTKACKGLGGEDFMRITHSLTRKSHELDYWIALCSASLRPSSSPCCASKLLTLQKLTTDFSGRAQTSSHYKRLQRFLVSL
jgi:hypothetical protein